jgi:hypothetical protein
LSTARTHLRNANSIPYDNTTSGLTASDIQAALDEIDATVDALGASAVTQLTDLTDVTAKTGTGTVVVMQGSPTLTTPTIASFVNATHDHTNAAGGGQLDHTTALTSVGTNTHAQIDTHIADGTVHFTEASIDHTAILNIGTNTHVQIDTHIADGTIHYTEASIDHGSIAGLGDDDHTQYLLANGTRALTANWDAGSFDIRAATLTADGLTSGRVVYAGTNGLLQDSANFTFDGTAVAMGGYLNVGAPGSAANATGEFSAGTATAYFAFDVGSQQIRLEGTKTTAIRHALVNLDNTTSTSDCTWEMQTGGSSGGDPLMRFQVTGVGNWNVGLDNSDSDSFKVGWGSLAAGEFILTTAGDGTISNSLGVGVAAPGVSSAISAGAHGQTVEANDLVSGSAANSYIHRDDSAETVFISSADTTSGVRGNLVTLQNAGNDLMHWRYYNDGASKIIDVIGDATNADWYRVAGGWQRIDLTAANGIFLNGPLYPQGTVLLTRTGDAVSTATQKSSNQLQFQNSLWTGSIAVNRSSSIYARASTTVDERSWIAFETHDESTGALVERASIWSNGGMRIGASSGVHPATGELIVTSGLSVGADSAPTNTLSVTGTANISSLTSGRVTYAGASGLLTDSSGLTYDGTTLNVATGTLNVGANDTTPGLIRAYGDAAASTVGGWLALYTAADHDTTNDFYSVRVTSDGLQIGRTTVSDIAVNSTGIVNVGTGLEVSDLTSGRVTYATTSGRLTDDAGLTYNGATDSLTLTQAVTGTGHYEVTDGVSAIQIFVSTSAQQVIRTTHATGPLRIQTNSTNRWDFDGATGDLLPVTANNVDIGSDSLPVALGYFRTLHLDGSTSGTVGLDAPATVTPYTITFPNAVPVGANYILESDASGNLSWIATPALTEVNDLSAAVTWVNVPDANITESSVTQHEAALTILESQITDGSILARVGGNEVISGTWEYTAATRFNSTMLQLDNPTQTFQYTMTTSAIAADRIVTWPLLLSGDTLVFENHIQTLAGKTLTTPTIASFTNATHDHADAAGGGALAEAAVTAHEAALAIAFSQVTGTVPATQGGTGQTVYVVGDTLYADTTTTLATLAAGATSGHVLTSNGSGVAPSWQAAAGGVTSTGTINANEVAVWSDAGSTLKAFSDFDFDGTTFNVSDNGWSRMRYVALTGTLTISNKGLTTPGWQFVPTILANTEAAPHQHAPLNFTPNKNTVDATDEWAIATPGTNSRLIMEGFWGQDYNSGRGTANDPLLVGHSFSTQQVYSMTTAGRYATVRVTNHDREAGSTWASPSAGTNAVVMAAFAAGSDTALGINTSSNSNAEAYAYLANLNHTAGSGTVGFIKFEDNGTQVFRVLFDGSIEMAGDLVMQGATSGELTFDVPATVTDYAITWPNAVPAGANYILESDASGNLSWIATPGGAEVNDLSAAVTWVNVPDANITQSSVTQHEAALTILESQITDSTILARVGGNETIAGTWEYTAATRFNSSMLQIDNPAQTFQYVVVGSAIVADRNVTLPLLTGGDTFVFNDFAATLTNKTIALGSNTISGTAAQFDTALTADTFVFTSEVGSVVQAFDAVLDDLAALSAVADNEFIVGTGAGTYAHESGATARTSLGVAIGSDVQAFGDVLDDLNTLGAPTADGEFLVATAAGVFAYETGATARASMGAGTGDGDVVATTGADTRIAVFNSSTGITGDANFLFDDGTAGSTSLSLTQAVNTSGQPQILYLKGGAHTTTQVDTEVIDIDIDLNRTVQITGTGIGTIAQNRSVVLRKPTLDADTPVTTITDAATFYIDGGPSAGANAIITDTWAFWIAADRARFDGGVQVTNSNFVMTGATSGSVTHQVQATGGDYTLVWPNAQASGTQVLQNNGSGTLSWATAATGTVTASGSPLNNEVAVFTSGTDIDSDSTFTWDGSILAVTGAFSVGAHGWTMAANDLAVGASSTNRIVYDDNASNFYVAGGTASTSMDLLVFHNDNTSATSDARLTLQVGGTSSGDPEIVFGIPAGSPGFWSLGVDNTDSDIFKIGPANGVSSITAGLEISGATTGSPTSFMMTQPDQTGGTPIAFEFRGGSLSDLANTSLFGAMFINLQQTWNFVGGVGATADHAAIQVAVGTLTADSSQTFNTVTGLYVEGAPAAGTNVTTTARYGIWLEKDDLFIDAGNLITNDVLMNGSTSGTMTMAAAAAVTDYTLTYPAAVAPGANYVLESDGSGNLSWIATPGGGGVTATGTPVDNQIAVWDSASSIEGDANLTWDGTTLLAVTASATTAVFELESSDQTGVGLLTEFFNSSSSPLANDILVTHDYFGYDSVSVKTQYAQTGVWIESPTNTTENGAYWISVSRNGTLEDSVYHRNDGVVFNETGLDRDFRIEGDSLLYLFYAEGNAATENIAMVAPGSPGWNSMDRGIFIGDASTAPTGNPSNGGYMYSSTGALTWRGSSGTITTIAAAEPHCPKCGRDYVNAWHNDGYDGMEDLVVCFPCMIGALDKAGISRDDYSFARTK